MADLLDNDNTPDDVYEGDDNGGGILGQPGDIFDRTVTSPVNPQITRGQEQAPETLPGTTPAAARRDLVFAQDAYGNVTVAWSVNGNIVEAFRAPTPEEAQLAPKAQWRQVPQPQPVPTTVVAQAPQVIMPAGPGRGVPVAMGIAALGQALPAAPVAPVAPPAPQGMSPLLKLALVAGGLYGAWWAYGKYVAPTLEKSEEDATEDEMSEADDVEEEAVV